MDKKKENKNAKSLLLLMGMLLLSGIFIYWKFLFGGYFLAFNDVGSDTWQQYVMQYHTIVNHIRNGNFSLWDFNNGFGVNMFQLNLFDPSLIILYVIGVIGGAEHMLGALVYVQLLRILAAGLVGYLFLSEFSLSERSKVFASYIYGLNGFLLVWGQHYQFGMITVYLPLILLMVERSVRKGKIRAGLPVAVFFTVIDSTYFGYMCCLTAGIYLIFRVLLLEGMPVKERLARFFRVCLGMLLGVGMGLVILLPSAYVIFGVTSRLESEYTLGERLMNGFLPKDRDAYKTLFYRFFSANLQNKNGDYAGSKASNYYEDPSVFASIFFVILGVQYLLVLWKMKLSRYKKAVLYGAAVVVGFALAFPFVSIVYNGFSAPFNRYTFALLPFFVLLIAWMTDYILDGGRISILGLIGVLGLSIHVYRIGYYVTNHSGQKKIILCMAVIAVISVFAVAILGFWKKKSLQRHLCLILLLLAVSDMCLEGLGTVTDRAAVEKGDRVYLSELYSEDVQDALLYIREHDDEFCRVEKMYPEQTISMSSLAQYYQGVSTYNSMQNGEIKEFVENCVPELFYANVNYYRFSQISHDGEIASFLGIRYLLSKEGAPENYEFVRSFNTINLYKAKEIVGIGSFFRADQAVTNEQFKETANNMPNQEDIDKVLKANLGVSLTEEELKAYAVDAKEGASDEARVSLYMMENDSHVRGEASVPSDGYLLLTIPYEGGWKLRVDGEKQEILKADLGFMGVQMSAGSHSLELDYSPPLLKEGFILSALCWLVYIIYFGVYKRKGAKQS